MSDSNNDQTEKVTDDRRAIYERHDPPEMDDNPLIAALRRPTDVLQEQLDRLRLKPIFSERERELPGSVRTFLLNRLQQSFFFPSTQHVQIYKDIEAQVIGGYWSRNPMTSSGQRLVHNAGTPGNHIERTTLSDPGIAATIACLMGLSGIGKSALMQRITAALGKPVIAHSNFKGKAITETQVTVVMRNCSDQPNYTTKAIAKLLADRIDELINQSLYGKFFNDKSMTRTHYIAELRRILTSNWVGVVIIDVFEHMSLAGTLGQKELLAMLCNLRDELGIPLILVGTYKAAKIFDTPDASVPRRLIDGGFHDLKRPASTDDDDFISFCEVAWKYQWVKNPIPIKDEIKHTLFDLSQGITAVVLMLFKFAQIEAIRSGQETVNVKTLTDTYASRLSPLHQILGALRSNNKDVLDKYDDLYLNLSRQIEASDTTNRLLTMVRQMTRPANKVDVNIPEIKQYEETCAGSMTAEQRATEILSCTTGLPEELA